MYYIHSIRFSNPAFRMLYLLGQTTTALWKILEERYAYEDINLAQSRILNILMHHNRPLTHAEICHYLYRESQTIGVSLNHLLEKGYVIKMVDQKDKRYVRIQITDEGRQIVKEHYDWMLPLCAEITSCFSGDELMQMDRSLDRFRDWLFEMSGTDIKAPLEGLSDVPVINATN